MLTFNVLRRRCTVETEIELFLFIYEMSQALAIVEKDTQEYQGHAIEGFPWYTAKTLAETAEIHKQTANRKVISLGYTTQLNYLKWYEWWLDYLYSLNDVEQVDLEKSRINGLDLSEWYPKGHLVT